MPFQVQSGNRLIVARNTPLLGFCLRQNRDSGQSRSFQGLSALDQLRLAQYSVSQALALTKVIPRGKSPHSFGMLFAIAVAGALSSVSVPLSKGRDGTFAKVLTLAWQLVELAPMDVFRYVQKERPRAVCTVQS